MAIVLTLHHLNVLIIFKQLSVLPFLQEDFLWHVLLVFNFEKMESTCFAKMDRKTTKRIILLVKAMTSKTSWLERLWIALSESDINLLNEYNSMLTRKLHSAEKCSDEDLILFLAGKRKLFRDFRTETYIPANIISEDSKKRKQLVALK